MQHWLNTYALRTLLAIAALVPFSFACIPDSTTTDEQVAGDNPGDDNDAGSPVIRGTLAVTTPAGAQQPRELETGYVIVAVSSATQQAYRGTVGDNGEFVLTLPDSEAGNTFVLTVLGPDGQPVGPILMAMADGQGLTGLKPAGEVDLGTIQLPENNGDAPLVAGEDGNLEEGEVDSQIGARLDENNVPVGVASFGKGEDSLTDDADASGGIDADKDGMVDLFDADDDGNGTVDDFEDGAAAWKLPEGSDIRANFFMNLKVPVEDSAVYYSGTSAQIDADLATRTVITFECMPEPSSTRSIVSAHLLDSPAPAYLPLAVLNSNGAGALPEGEEAPLWSASNYAFQESTDRFEAFVVPNAVMQAGDTFTVEIELSDGTTETYSRMLNYIFKRIPRLVAYGPSGALTSFDPTDPLENGTPNAPVLFDASKDLVTEFAPPQDETGTLLTNLDYALEFFFEGEGGLQLNDDIDGDATWPTPVAGTNPDAPSGFARIDVKKTDLTLTADGTYLITIPKEMLVSQVVLKSGGTANVSLYKLDIAAQCPSGNAALTFRLARQ
jgi:hypothetical protein